MLPHRIPAAPGGVQARRFLFLLPSLCLAGCAAMIHDVHLYYQQMAVNYEEAETKAKLDATRVERESAALLQAGETHKFKRSQHELARIKNWQDYCARQRERFLKAAEKTADPAAAKKDATPDPQPDTP